MTHEIKAALRETIRTSIIAVIPLLIIQLESGVLDIRIVAIAFVIGLLRGAESYLHKTQPENIVSKALQIKAIK